MSEFHQEGLQFLLECLSDETTIPANFYMGLCTDASPAENATVAGLTEISSTGYARQTVASDATDIVSATAGTNDRKVTLAQQTWTNSSGGNWTAVNTVFLTDKIDDTGKLIASAALTGAPVTLADTDSLNVTMVLQLNG